MTRKPKSAAVRGAPVVEAIFQATFEELVRVGYAGLTIEDVAVRAGVNKTTVYRRWPTKGQLVTAALVSQPAQLGALPDAGSVRGDLIEWMNRAIRFFRTVGGRALMRLALFDDKENPELAGAEAAWNAHDETKGFEAIINRAVARGELPRRFDRQILGDALAGTLSYACLVVDEPPAANYTVRLIDALLNGLLPQAKRVKVAPPPKARTRKSPPTAKARAGSARTSRRTANT